eukprot:SAG22_NODE_242_length_14104_cov_13.581935_6_plen_197_part_00
MCRSRTARLIERARTSPTRRSQTTQALANLRKALLADWHDPTERNTHTICFANVLWPPLLHLLNRRDDLLKFLNDTHLDPLHDDVDAHWDRWSKACPVYQMISVDHTKFMARVHWVLATGDGACIDTAALPSAHEFAESATRIPRPSNAEEVRAGTCVLRLDPCTVAELFCAATSHTPAREIPGPALLGDPAGKDP